jgi:hypothetical protein
MAAFPLSRMETLGSAFALMAALLYRAASLAIS